MRDQKKIQPVVADDSTIKPVPFRIVIGVTGHRKLQGTSLLRKTIQNALDEIIGMYPSTPHTPVKLCAFSPLAEGADRFVAQEVLTRDKDAMLKVVLPLVVADYLEDFETEASREVFWNLMEKCRSPLSLKEKSLKNEYPPEMQSEARRQAYEDVGKFVVEHCDVLIALWDGKEARGKGGTAHIVQHARDQKCPLIVINPNDPERYVFEKPQTPSHPLKQSCQPVFTHSEKKIELFRKIEDFNLHIKASEIPAKYLENIYSDLFADKNMPEGDQISQNVKDVVRKFLIPYYAVASMIAKKHQTIYHRVGLSVFLMAFLAVAIVGTGAIFFQAPPLVFVLELILLISISYLIFKANRMKSHQNWIEHRFQAERIRSAFFMAVCGIEISPVHFKRRSATGSDSGKGMQLAFEEIWNRIPRQNGCTQENCRLLSRYIRKAWFEDQVKYHYVTSQNNHRKSHLFENSGEIIFYVAMGAAFLHLVGPFFMSAFHSAPIEHFLTLAALLLPALASTIEAICSQREYKRLAIRSRKMALELTELMDAFTLMTPQKLEALVKKTDRLMLEETLEWLMLMSQAELYKAV